MKYWDEMTEEEQYADYLMECKELCVPALDFNCWRKS